MSAIRPVPHSPEVPIPIFKQIQIETDSETDDVTSNDEIEDADLNLSSSEPEKFNQNQLNDLVQELNLSKESAELLASRLRDKNLLSTGTKVTYYRNRDAEFTPYFNQNEELVYCNDVENVLLTLGIDEYIPSSWRLFIDSSKCSLKCVLLYNTNQYVSIPIGKPNNFKREA